MNQHGFGNVLFLSGPHSESDFKQYSELGPGKLQNRVVTQPVKLLDDWSLFWPPSWGNSEVVSAVWAIPETTEFAIDNTLAYLGDQFNQQYLPNNSVPFYFVDIAGVVQSGFLAGLANPVAGSVLMSYFPFLDQSGSEPVLDSYALAAVMMHEFGHLLGLGHSDNSGNMMWNGGSFTPASAVQLTPIQAEVIAGHVCGENLRPERLGVWFNDSSELPNQDGTNLTCGDKLTDDRHSGFGPEECEHNFSRGFVESQATTVSMGEDPVFSQCTQRIGDKVVAFFGPAEPGQFYCNPANCKCMIKNPNDSTFGPGAPPYYPPSGGHGGNRNGASTASTAEGKPVTTKGGDEDDYSSCEGDEDCGAGNKCVTHFSAPPSCQKCSKSECGFTSNPDHEPNTCQVMCPDGTRTYGTCQAGCECDAKCEEDNVCINDAECPSSSICMEQEGGFFCCELPGKCEEGKCGFGEPLC